jgi:hypothetical protein
MVWTNIKDACSITGRWHDARHTFITDLAENPDSSDQTLKSIAGHVSHRMLDLYNYTAWKRNGGLSRDFKADPPRLRLPRLDCCS